MGRSKRNFDDYDEIASNNLSLSSSLTRQQLADFIRQTWINEYKSFKLKTTGKSFNYKPGPKWDGGTDAAGRRFTKPVWPQVADIIERYKFDPCQYVKAQFEYQQTNQPPLPTILISQSGITNYRQYTAGLSDDLQLSYIIQCNEAKRAYTVAYNLYSDTRRAVIAVLTDTTVSLSALFRYCLAAKEGIKELENDWFSLAQRQYLSNPATYDRIWGDLIPSAIKKE